MSVLSVSALAFACVCCILLILGVLLFVLWSVDIPGVSLVLWTAVPWQVTASELFVRCPCGFALALLVVPVWCEVGEPICWSLLCFRSPTRHYGVRLCVATRWRYADHIRCVLWVLDVWLCLGVCDCAVFRLGLICGFFVCFRLSIRLCAVQSCRGRWARYTGNRNCVLRVLDVWFWLWLGFVCGRCSLSAVLCC